MTDFQHERLEQYETAAAECEMLARLTTDQGKQALHEHLAAHYRDLATGFRRALTMRDAAYASFARD